MTGRVVALAVALVLAPSGILSSPVHAADPEPRTAFFVDGWRADIYRGSFPEVMAFAEGAANVQGWMDRPSHIYVEAVTSEGWVFGLTLNRLDGQPVAPGTYDPDASTQTVLSGSGFGSCDTVTIEIAELEVSGEIDTSGEVISRLAADVVTHCASLGSTRPDVHASVRIASPQPFDALSLTPETAGLGDKHDFGTTPTGTSAAAFSVTITNRGTASTTVGGSVSGDGGFALGDGSCDGPLAPGASCTLTATFAASGAGTKTGSLHLLTPGLTVPDRTWPLTAFVTAPSAIALSVDISAVHDQLPGAAPFTVELSPPEATGWTEITLDCVGHATRTIAAGAVTWVVMPAGPCTASASFISGDGWLPSVSESIDFVMTERSETIAWAEYADMAIPGASITLHAEVRQANGGPPVSGTLRITDQLTGETLATHEVAVGSTEVDVTRSDFVAGDHPIIATYADGNLMGSTGVYALRIDPDDYPPDAWIAGPGWTNDPLIVLRSNAVDLPINIVTAMRVSNDGEHWLEQAWDPALSWSLADPAYGGIDVDGTHTIYAQFRDRAGNWSTPLTEDVVLDRALPEASGTDESVPSSGAVVDGALPVLVEWSGSDALSGIGSYTLERSTDGGAWTEVGEYEVGTPAALAPRLATVDPAPTTTGTVRIKPSHRYRFRVVAHDRAGNAAAGPVGRSITLASRSDAAANVTYGGRWTTDKRSSYLGRRAHVSITRGATATFKVSGTGFAWIATRSPSSGRAAVYLGGVRVATVDLSAGARRDRRVVFSATWATDRTRTVRIRVLGTAGHPRVTLDGFFTWR